MEYDYVKPDRKVSVIINVFQNFDNKFVGLS